MPDLTTETWGYCGQMVDWMEGRTEDSPEPPCNWTTDGSRWQLGDRCPVCGSALHPIRVGV